MKNKFIYLAILAAGFASCEPEFENPVSQDDYSAGDADFSSYVAVGNSLTAGYMDGTVSRVGQTYSFPNLLSQQFAVVGGGAFTQPSFAEDIDNVGGIFGVPGFNKRLVIDALQGRPEIISEGTIRVTTTPQALAYNNMGVPGAKSFHLLIPGYGSLNPYYARHATSPTATILGDAMSKNPTFFTNWIGANDVLAYATSGGIGTDRTGNQNIATYGVNDITDPQAFAFHYNLIINGGVHPTFGNVTGLAQNGAKGVVATIPSVTSIPYFTTVPYNALPAEATATNASALQLYGFLAQVTGGRILPLSTTPGTRNPVLIVDETLSDLSTTITGAASTVPTLAPFATALGQLYGRARQATSNDLILLPTSSRIGQPNSLGTAPFNVDGVTFPLQDGDVLIPSEKTAIANATTAYNASIRTIATTKGLAIADMNVILNQLVSGLRADNGTLYTANYFSGGPTEFQVLFSLDGVHPNARGYSVIANEVIKVINDFYNAKLPLLNPSNFPGINILPTN